MTTPSATEITRRLEPVAHDPFIDHLQATALQVVAGPRASDATSARPRG